jgi:hypothetical protein
LAAAATQFQDTRPCAKETVAEWLLQNVPRIVDGASALLWRACETDAPMPSFMNPPLLPAIHGGSTSDILPAEAMWAMTQAVPVTGGVEWQRLYSSRRNGASFLMLQEALVGYDGPTVLVVACDAVDAEPQVFAAYASKQFRDDPTGAFTPDRAAKLVCLAPKYKARNLRARACVRGNLRKKFRMAEQR